VGNDEMKMVEKGNASGVNCSESNLSENGQENYLFDQARGFAELSQALAKSFLRTLP
jgi:hypothetical protein